MGQQPNGKPSPKNSSADQASNDQPTRRKRHRLGHRQMPPAETMAGAGT
jgi:hypothetical protein